MFCDIYDDYFEQRVRFLCLSSSDPNCTDPMPIYAQLTKGRNLFVGHSSNHIQDESSLDGPPARRGGDSKVLLYI